MLAVTNARMKNISLLDRTALDNELKSEFGEGNYEILLVGEGFLISVNNIEYLVDKDGKVNNGNKVEVSNMENAGDLSKGGQYDGLTEDTAYRITCIEDLVEWSNNYNNYKDKNIKLEKTIDFYSTVSYNNPKAKTIDINGNGQIEELITELTTGSGFKAITKFLGIFNGQNNEIKNLFQSYTSNGGGLFTGNEGAIKQLTISGEISSEQESVGAFVFRNSGLIEDCKNYASVNSYSQNSYVAAGGICGINGGTVNKCANYGNIHGESKFAGAGGIVGYICGTIINCYNCGNVNSPQPGAILGMNRGLGNIINCYDLSGTEAIVGMNWENKLYLKNIYSIVKLKRITDKYVGQNFIENVNYLDSEEKYTKNYMQSQDFVDELNTYVNNYNEEHKSDENFVELRNLKYNEGSYPTFE